ncbi:MAG: hypothetical protein CM15mP82_4260 [Methanobacteriota archaeon]|nr:MAG: hypothetical protein CM15mP82_4260 [Euryarchaeota archaeon]
MLTNTGISISNKEPNIVGSHKGTFLRESQDPDWDSHNPYSMIRVKIDASVHTFACPLAPQRYNDTRCRFILPSANPVARVGQSRHGGDTGRQKNLEETDDI